MPSAGEEGLSEGVDIERMCDVDSDIRCAQSQRYTRVTLAALYGKHNARALNTTVGALDHLLYWNDHIEAVEEELRSCRIKP